MHVPCHLREIRGKRKITEIETTSGVHRGTLSLLERGRLFPIEKHVDALERAYGKPWYEWYPPFVVAVIARELEEDAA
jgi:transcriptional regulator with XRE-family HTH domain